MEVKPPGDWLDKVVTAAATIFVAWGANYTRLRLRKRSLEPVVEGHGGGNGNGPTMLNAARELIAEAGDEIQEERKSRRLDLAQERAEWREEVRMERLAHNETTKALKVAQDDISMLAKELSKLDIKLLKQTALIEDLTEELKELKEENRLLREKLLER